MEQGIIEQFANAIKQEPNEKKSTYSAIVSKVDEEGIIWVYVAGSDKETPTASSATEVKKGDTVTVEWRNNKLYIAGNYSSPSVGTERADAIEQTALGALNSANAASAAAASAKESAEAASGAAARAVTDAAAAASAASAASASAAAADAKATAAGNAASAAQQSADNAQTSASNASEYAARALGNLSTVQNVAETLNWIASHGTMTLTTDTALDPSHVYFVADPNGDYTVGGNRYSVVTEPHVADISTYYELSINQSLNNYVATHIAVDAEGLWIIPDSGGNKVLIATGNGSTYTDSGTYIVNRINGVDVVVAQFTKDKVLIGQTDDSHLEMDYRSMKLIDNDGNVYLHVYDLVDNNGQCTDVFTGDGTNTVFTLTVSISEVSFINDIVLINGEEVSRADYTVRDNLLTFYTPPNSGSTITCKYHPHGSGWYLKAYTLGRRRDNSNAGAMSFVEGDWNVASGSYSHAEGSATEASYQAAHAEGDHTVASNLAAHAEGYGTIASGEEAHAEGLYTIASGRCSHAEGSDSIAKGWFSHAEGWDTIARTDASHTEGHNTIASGIYSHVGGRNNKDDDACFELTTDTSISEDKTYYTYNASGFYQEVAEPVIGELGNYYEYKPQNGKYVVLIGNGENSDNRSNAFGLTWDGDIEMALDTSATSGTDKEIYDALVALGWDSDLIV